MLIGSHVDNTDPLAAAASDGADAVQFFLGNPQSWKKPAPREDAEILRASPVPLYVHAPYLINVASANNKVRIPSRKSCRTRATPRRRSGRRPSSCTAGMPTTTTWPPVSSGG